MIFKKGPMEEKLKLLGDVIRDNNLKTPPVDALTRRAKERKAKGESISIPPKSMTMVKDGKMKEARAPATEPKGPFRNPNTAIQSCANYLKNMGREVAIVLALDSHLNELGIDVADMGSQIHIDMDPGNVFEIVFRMRAHSFILAHNHPSSGDPTPSDDDKKALETIKHLGILLNRPMRDFVIIGSKGRHYSHRANNLDI